MRKFMLYTVLIITFLIVLININFSFYHDISNYYYDLSVTTTPVFSCILRDSTNLNNVYSAVNIANYKFQFNFSDTSLFKFRLLHIHDFLTTNTSPYIKDKLYIDRLYYDYKSAKFGITIGRNMYNENNGMIIGNEADGFKIDTAVLTMKQRFYVYLTPISKYNVNVLEEATNGNLRLHYACVLEKVGLIGRSLSFIVAASSDLNTNKSLSPSTRKEYLDPTGAAFSPIYFGVNLKGDLNSMMSYSTSFFYETGTTVSNASISAFAFDALFIYKMLSNPDWSFNVGCAYASGNDYTNDSTKNYRFQTFGDYSTSFVYNPDFANIFFLRAGSSLGFFQKKIAFDVDFYYFVRPAVLDNMEEIYSVTNDKSYVGSEVSSKLTLALDPNFLVFVNAGVFMRGDVFEYTGNMYKMMTGLSAKF